jgi:hypothetical protein
MVANEQESQGDKDHVETWFQTVINPHYSSIIKHLLALYQLGQLVPHILTSTEVFFF